MTEFGFEAAADAGFADRVAADFAAAEPFMAFLCKALDLQY